MPSPATLIGRALRGRRSDESLSIIYHPGLATTGTLHVESADFADGEPMPLETSAYDADHSPALSWSGVPEGTVELLLVMEDVDVPTRKPVVHTAALLAPTVTGVERGRLADNVTRFLSSVLGMSGYHGPRPVPGHGAHRYRFHIYALDATVDPTVTKVRDLPDAVAGHVLARGTVVGTYEKN